MGITVQEVKLAQETLDKGPIPFEQRDKSIDTLVGAFVQDENELVRMAANDAIKAGMSSDRISIVISAVTAVKRILRSAGDRFKTDTSMRSLVKIASATVDKHQSTFKEQRTEISSLLRSINKK
jgi:hypothetical protein